MNCDFDTWEVRPYDECPCAEHVEARTAKSYVVEVIADNSGQWCKNGLRFRTKSDAEAYGSDLFMRWTSVSQWRVTASDEEPNR